MQEELLEQLAGEQPQEEVQQEPVPEQNQEQIEQETQPPAAEEPVAQSEEKTAPPPGLIEERKKRQEAQELANKANERINDLESQVNEFKQYEQQTAEQIRYLQGLEEQIKELREKAEPKPEIPDYEQDPAGYLYYQNQQLQKQVEELSKGHQQTTEQTQHQEQTRQIINDISVQERAFANKNPDYQDAYNFVKGVKAKELQSYGLNDAQVEHELSRMALQTGYAALQHGKNPGEVIYNMAQAYGYAKQEQPPVEQPVNEQMQKDKATLETIEKGLEASKTLDSSGKPSAEELLKIEDEDLFNEALKEAFGPQVAPMYGSKRF